MRFQRSYCGLLALVFLLAPAIQAEQFVTMKFVAPAIAGGEAVAAESYTVWVGDSRVREDRSERTVIVDRQSSKMYIIEHSEKTYRAFDLPLKFEEFVPASMIDQWRTVLEGRKMDVAIEPTEETDTIAGFPVKKYDVVISSAMTGTMNLTLWNTADPGFDAAAYKALMLEMAAFQPGADQWIRKLFEIDGYPVRMIRAFETPDGTVISSEELVSVETREAPEGNWSPAEGYTEVEFNLLSEPPR